VLGGGNGTSKLLQTLLPLLLDKSIASLHALVHMSDDGGSTGRLRQQYGVAAVGDLTKCLLALSKLRGDVRGDLFLKALQYRFESGDFEGHTLRNMLLTALEKTSDIDSAISTMARVLQIPKYAGVVPTTLTTLTAQAEIIRSDWHSLLGEGEHSIAHRVNLQADPKWKPGDVHIRFSEGDVPLNPRAKKVLIEATHLIIAPGHTYGTILPTLALPALGRVIAANKDLKIMVVMTLLTTPGQTVGWSGEDFVGVYESYLGGRSVDTVITNTGRLNIVLVSGQEWVTFKEKEHAYQLIQEDIVSAEEQITQVSDIVPRAVVVHDSEKLQTMVRAIL